jgi:DNA excision repair protein ERCC-5
MGVTGLWKLIESSGKPVPLETLENKVLAIGLFTFFSRHCEMFLDYVIIPLRYQHLASSGR